MDLAVDSEAKKPRIQEEKKVSGHHGPHRAQRLGARNDFERVGRRSHAHVRHRRSPQRDDSHEAIWRFVLHENQRKKTRRTPTGTASHSRLPSDFEDSGGKARHRWSALEVERDVGLYIQHKGSSLRDSESMQAHESVQEHGHEDRDQHSPHGGGIAGQSTGESGSEASSKRHPEVA